MSGADQTAATPDRALTVPEGCPDGVSPEQWAAFKEVLPALNGKPMQVVSGALTLHLFFFAQMLDKIDDLDALQQWVLRFLQTLTERRVLLAMAPTGAPQ